MFRALCAHHQEAKLYYTAAGIITPVSGRPVHRLRADSSLSTCKWLSGAQVESGLFALNLRSGRPPTSVTIPDAIR